MNYSGTEMRKKTHVTQRNKIDTKKCNRIMWGEGVYKQLDKKIAYKNVTI